MWERERESLNIHQDYAWINLLSKLVCHKHRGSHASKIFCFQLHSWLIPLKVRIHQIHGAISVYATRKLKKRRSDKCVYIYIISSMKGELNKQNDKKVESLQYNGFGQFGDGLFHGIISVLEKPKDHLFIISSIFPKRKSTVFLELLLHIRD